MKAGFNFFTNIFIRVPHTLSKCIIGRYKTTPKLLKSTITSW